MDTIQLIVNNKLYDSWLSVTVNHSIENLAGSFSLEIANMLDAWEITAGDECVLKFGKDVLISGYIDSKTLRLEANSTAINVQGRDKTGDLVDCSVKPKQWQNLSFEAVAIDILKPFNILLYTQLDSNSAGYLKKQANKIKVPKKLALNGGGKFKKKTTGEGSQTAHETLKEVCKSQGVLLVSDRNGGLVVTRAGLNGSSYDGLVLGGNLLSLEIADDFTNLFSEISVKGQASGAVQDVNSQNQYSTADLQNRVKPNATVLSKNTTGKLNRYRPLIIEAEQQSTQTDCLKRAQWEVGNRQSNSRKITAKVQGWRQSNGELWEINTLTTVQSEYTDITVNWLIAAVDFSIDSSGSTCTITLISPLSFDILEEIPEKEAVKKKAKVVKKTTSKKENTILYFRGER
jgi:prophage tail gpP-like protein